jgi:hypothetical protein
MFTDLADLLLQRVLETPVLLSMLVGLQLLSMLVGLQLPKRYQDLILPSVPLDQMSQIELLDQIIPPDQGVLRSLRDHAM